MQTIKGVGLIVVAQDTGRILTLKELEDKPILKKKTGMLSIPEETIKCCEKTTKAMNRLIKEEIGVEIRGSMVYLCKNMPLECLLPIKVTISVAYIRVSHEFVAQPNDVDVKFKGWHELEDLIHPLTFVRVETRPILRMFRAYIN